MVDRESVDIVDKLEAAVMNVRKGQCRSCRSGAESRQCLAGAARTRRTENTIEPGQHARTRLR